MTYRPAPHTADTLLHSSSRTSLSTNADPAGIAPPRVVMRVTKLEIRWVDRQIAMRFLANTIEMKRATLRPNGVRR